MKISDLVIENSEQQVQEGPLGAIGRGIAKGAGALAKGAGMVAGVGRGLKTAYQKGKATSAAHIGGDVPAATQQKKQDPQSQAEYDKEYARLTQPQQKTEPTISQEPAAQQEPAAAPKPSFGQGTPMPTNPAQTPGAQSAPQSSGGDISPELSRELSAKLKQMANDVADGAYPNIKNVKAMIDSYLDKISKQPARPAADNNPNIVRGTESVQRRGKMMKESWDLFQPRKKAS